MTNRKGFSLVEVTMAIGIFAFVVVAILGLYSVAIGNMRKSQIEIHAANLASEILEDYRRSLLDASALRFALPSPSSLQTAVPAEGEIYVNLDGKLVDSSRADYRIRYALERQSGLGHRIHVYLAFLWPPLSAAPEAIMEVKTALVGNY
jgi:type II secretory pathway pseudopilin PulG